jgi:hypothetical protein
MFSVNIPKIPSSIALFSCTVPYALEANGGGLFLLSWILYRAILRRMRNGFGPAH